ncbi:MAG TPA: hypothetical protein VFW71_02100 [Actinomycetota bacterium]|nr:hypothetical protein [Actinomycetota bacterium]
MAAPRRPDFSPEDENLRQIGSLLLAGVAFGEMAHAVGNSLDAHGLSTSVVCVFAIFFTVGLSFAIGNYRGLVQGSHEPCWGWWCAHFVVAAVTGVILIFLGGRADVDLLRTSRFGFFPLLISLYAVDLVWLVVSLPRRAVLAGEVDTTVLCWMGFDVVLIGAIWGFGRLFGGSGTTRALVALAIVHLVKFVIDLKIMVFPLGPVARGSPLLGRVPRLWAGRCET